MRTEKVNKDSKGKETRRTLRGSGGGGEKQGRTLGGNAVEGNTPRK